MRKVRSWLLHRLLIGFGRRFLLVTGVRDPVAQILSRPPYSSKCWRHAAPSVDALARWFLDNVDHEFPLHWFDREFLPITGIEVYSVPFDNARGWTILERATTRCLILKLETSDAAKEEGLRTLLGVQGFRLESFNRTEDKLSADRYLALKAKVRLPREVMDRLLAARYVRHSTALPKQSRYGGAGRPEPWATAGAGPGR